MYLLNLPQLLLNKIYRVRFIVYGAILAVATVQRFYNPQIIYLDPDAHGYLMPAVNFLTGEGFTHNESRSWLYPLFVTLVLGVFKSFKALCVLQHLTGIVTGVLLIRFFEQLKDAFSIQEPKQIAVWTTTSLFSISTFLLSGNIMLFEHTLRPEALISLYLTIYVMTLWRFYIRQQQKLFVTIMVLSIVGLLAFPRLLPANMAVIIWATATFFGSKNFTLKQKTVAVLATACFALLILLPEMLLIKKYDEKAKVFPVRQMFYSYSHVMLRSINENSFPDNSPYELDMAMRDFMQEAILNKPDNKWKPILKYDPDDLQYGACNRVIENYFFNPDKDFGNNTERINALHLFYFSWLRHITLHYPAEVARKIGNQFFYVLLNYKISMVSYTLLIYDLHSSYTPPTSKANSFITETLNYPLYYQQTYKLFRPLHLYHLVLIIIFKITFPLLMLYGFIMLFKPAGFFRLLYLYFFLCLLLVAVTHTFDIPRYLHSLLIPFLFLFSFAVFNLFKIYAGQQHTTIS